MVDDAWGRYPFAKETCHQYYFRSYVPGGTSFLSRDGDPELSYQMVGQSCLAVVLCLSLIVSTLPLSHIPY
jgi:hypothetical protein